VKGENSKEKKNGKSFIKWSIFDGLPHVDDKDTEEKYNLDEILLNFFCLVVIDAADK
jgi:hypothetical protein